MGQINTAMLILARESRGLTQGALAEATGLSQANISKYESGLLSVSEDHLARIAEQLAYPPAFFALTEERYGFGSGCTYHRKRQTMPVQELKTILARVNVERIRVNRLLLGLEIEADNSFARLDIDDFAGDAGAIAGKVRTLWRLPPGRVDNLTKAIEGAGGLVVGYPFGTQKMDAISQWPLGSPPIFFVNIESPTDRLRFDLAHELGHLFMHRGGVDDSEAEADQFAAEFLMPAREIAPDLMGVTLPKLAQLKAYWKVSMAALIRRAHDLHMLSDRQYRSLFEQLSKGGYRVREPVELPVEVPTVVDRLVSVHREDLGYSTAQMSELLVMLEKEYRDRYEKPVRRLRPVS